MTVPAVSVIMPAYNRADLIAESIGSVLAQTRGDFELIVVDDGSTDDTVSVVQRFDNPRVRIVRGSHGGIAAASNLGIRSARGRYLARLGSDDLWDPRMLETQLRRAERDPSVGVVYAMARIVDAHGKPRDATWGYAPRFPGDMLCSLLYDDCVCDITTLARTDLVIAAGGYDESLTANVDWDLWLRLARLTQFAFTPEVLAFARIHVRATTHPKSPVFATKIHDRKRVLDKLYASPALPASALAMKPIAYRNLHTNEGFFWLSTGQHRRALHAFATATTAGPGLLSSSAWVAGKLLANLVVQRSTLGRRALRAQAQLRRRLRGLTTA
jgi:glycosyltransferase involved in cell wall biosynthesis